MRNTTLAASADIATLAVTSAPANPAEISSNAPVLMSRRKTSLVSSVSSATSCSALVNTT